MKTTHVFLASALLTIACSAQDFQGTWHASIKEQGASVGYVLHISEAGGKTSATVDIPESFIFNVQVDSVAVDGSSLQLRSGLNSYHGALASNGEEITGDWFLGAEQQAVQWHRLPANSMNRIATVATRLQDLMYIPSEKWRFHTGDTPHGEAIDLDDSGWESVGPNTIAPAESVWYRRWIEIPQTLNGYDLSGSRIWFDFQYDANGPVTEILYFNGRRVAMGEELESVVLFEHARPGDKVLVAVKLMRSVDQKHFLGTRVRIEYPDTHPDPAKLFAEMGAVSILRPFSSASNNLQDRLARAADAIDLDALKKSNQAAFEGSLAKARETLEPARSELQQSTIHLTGNSHIDAAWLWPWTETVEVVRRTFGTTLQLMEEYPQFTYAQSAAAYSEWMYQKYPSIHQQILNRVKEGRWEMVGGMWVEPDLNMPDGESLVRQLLIGKRFFKDKFGADIKIGWNPDSFGYNWQLPQIYKRSGIDYFVTQKMAWNDSNQLPLKLFWWQSPDGSRVLTYFPHDYVNEIEPLRMTRDLALGEQLNPGAKEMMHLFGMGDHGGGVTRAMLDEGMQWSNPKTIFPQTSFGTALDFFHDVERKVDTEHAPTWNYRTLAEGGARLSDPSDGKLGLPVWNDELYFEYHRGVFTTQAKHKRNMRESEEQLLNAEKISALAWLSGQAYPAKDLTEAWKKVLFNQFHDLAAGSGIGQIYRDAQQDYDSVRMTTEQISQKALHHVEQQIDTRSPENGVPVLVVNPLAWNRTDIASVDLQLPESIHEPFSIVNTEGEEQPFQVLSKDSALNTFRLLIEVNNVPSMGYRVLHVVPKNSGSKTDLQANGLTLENAFLRLAVDSKSGCITSLYDKKSKFEYIAANGCGNQLVAFKDTPKDYDAWNIDADFQDHFTNLETAQSVALVETGPLRATIRVVRTWQNSEFVQDISLYANLDRVDVHNEFDWHENHVLLKAAFPLAASSNMATYEIPYGAIERPTTRNNRFEAAKFEVPALRWADLGNGNHGLSLINESKYGYDAKGNVLRISLLRSPTWPDPEADRGHHSFSYSLYPHTGDWKQALSVQRGYEFNYRLSASQQSSHQGTMPSSQSFVKLKENNVVLTAIKKTEDGDALLLRFYEWAGKNTSIHIVIPKGAVSAERANLMEEPDGSKLPIGAENSEITVPVHAYEIVSLRVGYDRQGEQ